MNQQAKDYFNDVGLWPDSYFVIPGESIVWRWVPIAEAYHSTKVSYCVLPQEQIK